MAKHVRRIGLVELHVELPQRKAADLNALVRQSAARDASRRARTVKSILASKKLEDVDVLVFPGWTLRRRKLPRWVTTRSRGRTIVIELDDLQEENDGRKGSGKHAAARRESRSMYVVHDERNVISAAQQQFAIAADADDDRCRDLVVGLSSPAGGRTFYDANLGRVGILICGEVNLVHRRHGPTQLPDGFPALDIILNPAHTPSPLQAMREKRRRLSEEGALVATTANVHSQWNRNGKTGSRASKAAQVFVNGQQLDRDDCEALTFDGAKVLVVDIPARTSTARRSARSRRPSS